MIKKVSRRVIIYTCLAAVIVAYLFFGETRISQSINMRKARKHIPIIKEAIVSKPQFGQIWMEEFTGSGGSILVRGIVENERDLRELKILINITNPPVLVNFLVDINGKLGTIWISSWAESDKINIAEARGDYDRLKWPTGLPYNIMEGWAKDKKVFGLTVAEVKKRIGEPIKTLVNESDGSSLMLYEVFCVRIHAGKCDGYAPRAPNYEKFFMQPDL